MSVSRQENWLGQQRVDVPHLRAVESSIASDFDLFAGSIVAGSQARVVSGFQVVMSPSPLSGPATSLLVNTGSGVLMHPLATESGTLFQSPTGRTTEQLNSGSNTRVIGSFVANAVNYLGIDLRRAADSGTSDTVMFLDPVALQEAPKIVPLARTLDYVLVISTTDFSSTPGICPIAKITTDANNNVSAVVDCRRLMFRLGSGGSVPNIQNTYSWPTGRAENTSGDVFYGGDKGIPDFKSWMDAVMTRIQESNGGQYWYSPVTSTNIKLQRHGAVLANGEYFSWDGTTLTWQGLTFLIPNSAAQFNDITNGSTTMIEGDCVYVDLDFTTNRSGGTALTMTKAQFTALGASPVPGARMIVAWRLNSVIYTRDGNWPVGTLFQPATNTALGLVQLLTAANTPATPIVATVDTATNMLVAAGLSRRGTAGSLGGGAIAIGNDALDTSVVVGHAGINTTIAGTAKLDTLDKNAATAITCNTSIKATASQANDNGLEGTGNGTGSGGVFKGGSSGPGVVAQEVASNDKPVFLAKDRGGNTRFAIDHNGYPMGQLGIITETWWPDTLTSNPTFANNALLFNNRWKSNTNSGGNTSYLYGVDGQLLGPTVWMTSDTTINHTFWTGTSTWLFGRRAGSVHVFEWTFNLHDNLNQTWMHGLWDDAGGGTDPMTPGNTACWFQRASGGNWKTFVLGGAPFDTGVAPNINSFDRFRIEIYGETTPLAVATGGVGAGNTIIRFFINGVLVRTETNVSPWSVVATAKFGWYCKNTAALGGAGSGIMGPFRAVWNMFDNPTAL
jgi:hypothetical protein